MVGASAVLCNIYKLFSGARAHGPDSPGASLGRKCETFAVGKGYKYVAMIASDNDREAFTARLGRVEK